VILLTGFEPFTTGQGLVLSHNPTADIVARVTSNLHGVRHDVLPVSFRETARVLVEIFETVCPRIWIGLGFAPHQTTWNIETLAVNMEHAEWGDNDGDQPWMREIIPGAPAAFRTRLDVKTAQDALAKHGVVAEPSFNAGTFLCNQAFYLGCYRCEVLGEMDMAAFIHVPPTDAYGAFEAGLTEILTLWA